jgi:hypothetical protein
MNNLYTPLMVFILILFSGLNCHNRTAKVDKPVMYNSHTLTWNDLQITSSNIDSNLSILETLCSNLETATVKKKIPPRRLIELIAPNGAQRTFIFNDTTLQK